MQGKKAMVHQTEQQAKKILMLFNVASHHIPIAPRTSSYPESFSVSLKPSLLLYMLNLPHVVFLMLQGNYCCLHMLLQICMQLIFVHRCHPRIWGISVGLKYGLI